MAAPLASSPSSRASFHCNQQLSFGANPFKEHDELHRSDDFDEMLERAPQAIQPPADETLHIFVPSSPGPLPRVVRRLKALDSPASLPRAFIGGNELQGVPLRICKVERLAADAPASRTMCVTGRRIIIRQ